MPAGERAEGKEVQNGKGAAAAGKEGTQRRIPWSEVEKHVHWDDCWTCIDGKVYDLTRFARRHPGGKLIMAAAGRDGTPLYQIHHPFTTKPDVVLSGLQIGVIDSETDYYAKSPFFAEMITRLKAKGITKLADVRDNATMMFKCFALVALWFYFWHVAFMRGGSFLGAAAFGIVTACIGMLVMHDGNHQGTSVGWFNWLAGETMTMIGGNSQQWTFGHIFHHQCPNQEIDPDTLQSPLLLRYRPDQPWRPHFRFQHIYAWFLYCLVFLRKRMQAFEHIVNPQDFGGIALPAPTKRFHLYTSIGWLLNMTFVCFYPCYVLGWRTFLPIWLLEEVCGGLLLALVFQVNHITIHSELRPGTRRDPKVDWAIDQILGSNNFTHGSPRSWGGWILAHLTGGLGFQIEHHLMPVSSHTKLILLSDVVEQMCKEQNVRYVMHRSLTQALDSHMQLLLLLGPEEYKKQKAAKKA